MVDIESTARLALMTVQRNIKFRGPYAPTLRWDAFSLLTTTKFGLPAPQHLMRRRRHDRRLADHATGCTPRAVRRVMLSRESSAAIAVAGLAHYRRRGTIVVESESASRKYLRDEAAAQRP